MESFSATRKDIPGHDDLLCVQVRGYLDTSTSLQLEKLLRAELEQGHVRLLLDLAAVDYISSAGWGVFLSVVRALREVGGDLVLCAMQSDVVEVYNLLEFNSVLRHEPTLEDALQQPS